MTKISLIMAIHNEEAYLPKSLSALKENENEIDEFIFILDRCIDNSERIVKSFFPNAKIIIKNKCKWKNSYAENLQLGFQHSTGDIIFILDADIRIPKNLIKTLLPKLKGKIASVSPKIVTDKNASLLNLLYYYWEKTYRIAPLGKEPRGGCRLIKRKCLEEVNGFKDVIAPDTQLDLDLRKMGYESKFVENVICYHLRKFSFKKAMNSQIMAGRMRKQINMPFWRVLGHSILRIRPLVILGYLKEALNKQ